MTTAYPASVNPFITRPRLRDVVGLGVCDGELQASNGATVEPAKLLDFCLGKTVYVSLATTGEFDALIAHLSPPTLARLFSRGHVTQADGFAQIWRRADRSQGYVTVQKGNQFGTIINAWLIAPDTQCPHEIERRVRGALRMFGRHDLASGDLRTPGNIAALVSRRADRFRKLPNRLHTQRFHHSYRGARFEGVTFGKLTVYDYDISSAYPSVQAKLPALFACEWRDSLDLRLSQESAYAAALCDVEIPENLERGPVALRYGEDGEVFYPVGRFRAWLNLPEIRLLQDYPDCGRILRVYHASWGLPRVYDPPLPFERSMRELYAMRGRYPDYAPYIKAVMVSMYGRTASTYVQDGSVVANAAWNPVYASAITSELRARIYRETMDLNVAGEWADGAATSVPIPETSGMGGMRLEGAGEITIVNDAQKIAAWKPDTMHLAGLLESQRDAQAITASITHRVTLGLAISQGLPIASVGKQITTPLEVPIGASGRVLPRKHTPLRCGDLLDGTIETYAPLISELDALLLRRRRWNEFSRSVTI